MDQRELTREERAAIRALVVKWCANYDWEYGCLLGLGPTRKLCLRGGRRSNGVSELSPQAEARDVELATTKGAASRTHRTFPLGGRWPGGPDEGATDRFVLGGHTGPPLRTKTTVIFVGAVFDRPPNKKPGPPGGRPWRYRI